MPRLERTNPSRSSRVEFDRSSQEFLGRGLKEGEVHRIQVRVIGDDGRSHTIPLAEKIFNSPFFKKHPFPLERLLEIHAKLKELHIPTLPTMRIEQSEQGDKLYLTDLTANGRNDCISMYDWYDNWYEYHDFDGRQGKYADGVERPLFEVANTDELSREAARLIYDATTQGVELCSDDIFFLVINKATKKAQYN